MKTVLCYGDSNTWGYVPNPFFPVSGAKRYAWNERWPGRLQNELGSGWLVTEEGLNGRTTVFDEPAQPGRNGIEFLPVAIASHCPLDWLVLMLGTNDTKPIFGASAWYIAAGLEALVKTALNGQLNNMQPLQILVVSPAPLGERLADSWLYGIFDESSVEKSKALSQQYRRIAGLYGAAFLDAADIAPAHSDECVHLTAPSHAALASAVAQKIRDTVR